MTSHVAARGDKWAQWIMERRFGGDRTAKKNALAEFLIPVLDRVLDAAEPLANQRILDVGCGDGLIGFGALGRGAREAVFSDISRDLLAECEKRAANLGVRERCRFLLASADDLRAVESASVDVVAVRSVLIYIADKRACFEEFARVLRPGGRLSIFEPVNQFGQREWTGSRFFGADVGPVAAAADKVRAHYSAFLPADDPMLNFDERDLIDLAEDAGFSPVDLNLAVEVRRGDATPWDAFLSTAGSPKLPTPGEAIMASLVGAERDDFIAHLRPLIESGQTTRRAAHAYLRGVRTATDVDSSRFAKPS